MYVPVEDRLAAHLDAELSLGTGVRVNHAFADTHASEFVAVADEVDAARQHDIDRRRHRVLIARSRSAVSWARFAQNDDT